MTTVATTMSRGQKRERAAHLGPEKRRPQILDAALSIAVESGTAAVTIGAIAERLGVTRPVIYTCFADRVAVLEALIEREAEELTIGCLAALHTARGTEPEAVFITGYQALLKFVSEQPAPWRLVFSTDRDESVSSNFAAARATVSHSASRWIEPAMQAWWGTTELPLKLPILIELFMSSAEAATRSLLDPGNDWSADELGEFYGRVMSAAFKAA